jgi:hypothetical protein
MKDIIGKKFGLLTVVEYSHPSFGSRGKHYWKCKCECGNTSTVRDSHLLSGTIRSCGCLHRKQGKDSPFFKGCGEIPLDYFSIIRRGAIGGGKLNRKPKEFNITIEYIWELFLKQKRKCALSGLEIGFEGTRLENKCKNTSRFTASLDRIDSSLGYLVGNIQWVHKHINIMKNSFDTQTFLYYCKSITEYNK